MKEMQMLFNGKVLNFQITFSCKEYVFAECKDNPSARGFFTADFIKQNKK